MSRLEALKECIRLWEIVNDHAERQTEGIPVTIIGNDGEQIPTKMIHCSPDFGITFVRC